MKIHDFGSAVRQSLAAHGGVTRMACGRFNGPDAAGIEVWEWPDGRPDECRLVLETKDGTRGDPSIARDGGRWVVGYFDASGVGRVIDADTGALIVELGVIEGNYPILVGEGRVVYQRQADRLIYERSPIEAEPRLMRDGNGEPMAWRPTGLAYLTPGSVVMWDDNRLSMPGVFLPARAGAFTAAQGPHGGMVLELDGARGVYPGSWNDPSACAQADGAFAFAGWEPTLRVVGGVTKADIEAMGEELPPEPVVPVDRALWFGFFEFAGATDCPVNCRLPVEQGAPWLTVRDLDGQPIYRYVSGHPDGDPDAIDLAVSRGREPGDGLDVLAYVPRGAAAVRLPDAVVGIECYRRAGESVDDFEAYIRRVVSRCRRAVLIAQCYTSNHTLTSDLRSVPPVIARVARDAANVEGVLVFSGSGRETGYQHHPEVQPDWRQVAASIRTPERNVDDGGGPVSEPIPLHPDVMSVIRLYAAVYPIPEGDGPDSVNHACRMWTEGLCQTVKARFPEGMPGRGGEFGWKRADPGRDPSKESLALIERDGAGNQTALHCWDLLRGVGTGRPVLNENPTYHDIMYAEGIHLLGASQVFIPVPAIDHLRDTTDDGRPTIQTPHEGIGAFDLGRRFAEGDREYFDDVIVRYRLKPRIVVSSAFRTWKRNGEVVTGTTFLEGLEQMPAVMVALQEVGLRAQFTLAVDTAEPGRVRPGLPATRDDVRNLVIVFNTLAVRYPDAIAGIRLANENSHSVEAPFMRDRAFLRELRALIDRQFPVSVGTGHGGEEVLEGGSYLTHHSDRGRSPEDNARIMAEAHRRTRLPVLDDEAKGTAESNRVAGRQRTDDVHYAARLVELAKEHGYGGVTWHGDVAITCLMSDMGPVQRESIERFVKAWRGAVPGPEQGSDVTTEKIATVFAGGFFDQVSTLLKLSGTVEARRSAVHGWAKERIVEIDKAYRDIFKRGCDLEGYGSRLRLYLDHGWTVAELRAALQRAYDAGDR